ncbi:hypothetical protein M8818_000464 [Zalaria obscura]|uniref:Uncharacterized protein n=1 Tax=Zalaria obscura TaxID=2024903 RepID=A0ACC3SNU9_9PEZI
MGPCCYMARLQNYQSVVITIPHEYLTTTLLRVATGTSSAEIEDFHTSVRYVDDVKPHASKSARWPDDDLFNALQRCTAKVGLIGDGSVPGVKCRISSTLGSDRSNLIYQILKSDVRLEGYLDPAWALADGWWI